MWKNVRHATSKQCSQQAEFISSASDGNRELRPLVNGMSTLERQRTPRQDADQRQLSGHSDRKLPFRFRPKLRHVGFPPIPLVHISRFAAVSGRKGPDLWTQVAQDSTLATPGYPVPDSGAEGEL